MMHTVTNTMDLVHDASLSMLLALLEASPVEIAALQATHIAYGIQDGLPGASSSGMELDTLTPPEASSSHTASESADIDSPVAPSSAMELDTLTTLEASSNCTASKCATLGPSSSSDPWMFNPAPDMLLTNTAVICQGWPLTCCFIVQGSNKSIWGQQPRPPEPSIWGQQPRPPEISIWGQQPRPPESYSGKAATWLANPTGFQSTVC